MPSSQRRSQVTIKEIAKALGVTHSSVSMALRDHPRISQELRRKVRETARQMGYQPNPLAVGLAHFKKESRIKPIQAALAWFNLWADPKQLRKVPLFDSYWTGARDAAQALGYRLEEFHCAADLSPARLKEILLASGIHGILLPPRRPPVLPGEFEFDWSPFAVVRLGASFTYPPVHMVTHSHVADTLEAIEQIRAKGYRRIAHFTSATLYSCANLAAGYLKAREGFPKTDQLPVLVFEDWPKPTPALLETIDRWMKRFRPDAVYSTESNIRLLLESAGYRVPQDVAVATHSLGTSDVDAGMFENPEEVGRAAVKFLVGQVERGETGLPGVQQHLLVRGQWRDGASLP